MSTKRFKKRKVKNDAAVTSFEDIQRANWNRNQFYESKGLGKRLRLSFVTPTSDSNANIPSSQPISDAFMIALGLRIPTIVDQTLEFSGYDGGDSGPVTQSEARDTDSKLGKIKLKKAKRAEASEPLLTMWKEKYRSEYLDLEMAGEGRGRIWIGNHICVQCHKADAEYRCKDCAGRYGFCHDCIWLLHRYNPLHFLEKWNPTSRRFTCVTMMELGYSVQLGHHPMDRCPMPLAAVSSGFTVIASNGIHTVSLLFCGCPDAPSRRDQLMEFGWWPATEQDPRSATTSEALRKSHIINLNARTPPTEIYRSYASMTCGDGLTKVGDRLTQFMSTLRQWRHVKMLKRAARAYYENGINTTAPGELCIRCRACPHPDINLPAQWKEVSPEISWIYSQIIAQDANFKQKSRLQSNKKGPPDPVLGPGWGTFVENTKYLDYVAAHAAEEEINHCVGFAALWDANRKRSKGLRATGIAGCTCARHQAFLPNGMGDLQKGERYANMDYVFLSAIHSVSNKLKSVTVSYDISCQWSQNLIKTRAPQAPTQLALPEGLNLRFRVPKFHLPCHTKKCWIPYAFNYTKWVGMTDGEGVERIWSWLNGVARSLSVMTFGGRSDTMDDFCAFYNWRRTISLADDMMEKTGKAIPRAIIHYRAFRAFSETLAIQHSTKLKEWELQVRTWENDPTSYCPYDVPELHVTMAAVKKVLADADNIKMQGSDIDTKAQELTPSEFIILGLDLEEMQREIIDHLDKNTTLHRETSRQTKRTVLIRGIKKFRKAQSLFMPGLRSLPGFEATGSFTTPERLPLHLPSSKSMSLRAEHAICQDDLVKIEDQLREAQAYESLEEVRTQLRTRVFASRFTDQNLSGQVAYTRSQTWKAGIESRLRSAKARYVAAHSALLSLRPPEETSWQRTLREMKPEDVRGISERVMNEVEKEEYRQDCRLQGLSEDEIKVKFATEPPLKQYTADLSVGQSKQVLSWIWFSTSKDEMMGGGDDLEGSIRLEWLKCRARAHRWKEELILLEEEMRRSIAFCLAQKERWKSLREQRLKSDPQITKHLAEGLYAYAEEHADAEAKRAMLWLGTWEKVRERAELVIKSRLGAKEEEVTEDLPDVEVPVTDFTLGDDDEVFADDDIDIELYCPANEAD